MADPAITGLAGALGGATISQLLAGWFASRRDRRADLLGQQQQLRADLLGQLGQLREMLDRQQAAAAEDREDLRQTLFDVREKVAGIEGVLRVVLPATPFEKRRRGG